MNVDVPMIIKIFFLLNPLASMPLLFVACRKGMDEKKIALEATLLAFLVALMFLFFGPLLFDVFGISLNSFRTAGGIIITLLGLSMARESKDEEGDISKEESVISLVATPLLTGPATLSYLILTTAEVGITNVFANLLLAFILVGIFFNATARLIPNINLELLKFAGRLLGLFILALGIEMLAAGIKGLM
ncbi:MarC family integral membrane protein [uncultured archaeon]|nr:MarC family integral membrane protein [uncultured archaeon]